MANKKTDQDKSVIPIERIAQAILIIRGQKVMLDSDLARLYGANTKRLNEQVKCNKERFPEDFMFQLTKEERNEVVANCDHLDRLKYSATLPHAFTEHGAIMAANVLSSQQAITASIFVVRAFLQLREMLAGNKELAQRLDELERRIDRNDETIVALLAAIRELMSPTVPVKKRHPIGFSQRDDG